MKDIFIISLYPYNNLWGGKYIYYYSPCLKIISRYTGNEWTVQFVEQGDITAMEVSSLSPTQYSLQITPLPWKHYTIICVLDIET